MTWTGLPVVQSWTIDYKRDRLEFVTSDGCVFRMRSGARRSKDPLGFKSVTFRPTELVLETVPPWVSR